MHSLPYFNKYYPVRTVYTDNEIWRRCKDWQDVNIRRDALQDYLCVPLKQVLYAREVHSGNVFAFEAETGGSLAFGEKTDVQALSDGYDALVTDVSGILLCIWTADCLPLYLYDTEKHIAAIAHCGWRGILSGIVSNTVCTMTDRFGADPAHIIAGFGPGICGNCYEVSEDLHEAFLGRFSPDEMEAIFCLQPSEKYLLDLRKAIRFELCRTGILAERICSTEICSYESEVYASYRRSGPTEPARQTLSGIVLR